MNPKTEKNKITEWFISKPKISGFLVFLVLFVIVCYIIIQRYQLIRENENREMSNILQSVSQNIEQSLNNATTSALTLALTIDDAGKPKDFETVGRQLLESNPGIDAVQLVPNGVIKYVYPVEGNENAFGFDIMNSTSNRAEVLKSIASKKIYFAGPLKLRQGGLGVVGRLPIFIGNDFWGFSAVVIELKTLIMTSGMYAMDDSNYYFQLSHGNPVTKKEELFLSDKSDFSNKNNKFITFPNSDWKLYVIQRNKNDIYLQILPLLVSGLLLSVLFGWIITILLRKPAQLQKLVLKQARKITQSQLKYKTMFDQAAMGIAHVDSNTGKFIDVNNVYCKLLGYSQAEMKNMNFMQLTHPDDQSRNMLYLEELRDGKVREFSTEKRYVTKSGDVIWVNLTISPLWGKGEPSTSQIAIIEDITLKKEAKEKIAISEARFKSLFEDSPVALWEEDFSSVKSWLSTMNINKDEAEAFFNAHPEVVQQCTTLVKITDVNNECLKLHHPHTKAALLAGSLDYILNQDSMVSFIKQLVAIVTKKTEISMDTRILNSEGGYRDIHLRWTVMRGYEDSLERVIISTEDITAQKEYERIIMTSQQRIETLIDTIDGIVWECDYDTYIFTFINKRAEDILGYSVEDWKKDPQFWASKIHPDDRNWALSYCKQQSEDRTQYDFEYRMIAKDGAIIWLRDIVNVVKENGKPISLKGIMIDITKNKEAENDLNSSLELVNEQKKRLMNFSYIVSHNLRSHTANIQSIMLLIDDADCDEERDELLRMLKTVSGSLNETMDNLNDLVNIQANITLAIEPLRLQHYINSTIKILSEQIEAKNATIISNIPADVSILYNPAYLESILLNLVSNAIRYSHLNREPEIRMDWLQEEGKNVLRVADNGIGIDMKRYGDKLFGMYKTFNGNADARGIGLFMTKSQIEAMGGKITVESEPGIGTTFKVYFK